MISGNNGHPVLLDIQGKDNFMNSKRNNTNGRKGSLIIALLMTVCLAAMAPINASAQGTVRAWGMGGAQTAGARGLEAVQYNPANLAISNGTSIGLAGVALDVHNNALSLNRYNEITGAYLDQSDKEQILSEIPSSGFRMDADVRASVLGLQTGSFALSFGAIGAGQGNLDKDYFDLVLFGNELGETVDFSNTHGEGYALGMATLSYGGVVRETDSSRLSFGLNAHYLQGIYEMHVDEASGFLSTEMSQISGEAMVATTSSDGGAGYAFDVGMALQAPGGWTLGLVMDNAFSNIDWNSGVERQEYHVTAADLSLTTDDMDSAITDSDTTYAAPGYSTTLPRQLRIGAANRFGSFNVAVDYVQGFENRGMTSTSPQFNLGTEWWLTGIIQPRFGISIGGNAGSGASAGLGLNLGFWRVDFAAVTRGGLTPNNTKGIGLALGTSLEF
jgi:hypothetical protein